MEKEEVKQIVIEVLKERKLYDLYDIFSKEHNPLRGHKECIGKYVRYGDIQDTP